MTATARAAINRENAQSSTGPRTSAGKERSSRNSLAHGMASKAVVLPHENADEYEAMHRGLLEAYKPANDNENTLVDHVAQAYWRLQRCYGVERAFLDNRIAAAENEDPEMAMANLFIDKAESARMRLLMRYLGSAERAYNKALSDLQKAQAARRKEEREQAAVQQFREVYAKSGFVSHTPQTSDYESLTPTASAGSDALPAMSRAA